jgi:hypothetical protein
MTFSTFLTYGIAMLALVALIGKVATRETAPSSHVVRPTSWFIRLSHVALAAIAGICFSLQYLLGQQEQIPLVAVTEPLASPIVGTLTLNDMLLCLPAGILLLSLWRFKRPFEAVDRVLLALLGILWIPLQYTFGQAELTHVHMFAQTSAASSTPINLFLITAPLAAAGIALSWARAGLEWLDQMALLTLAVVSGWLQNFQQGLFFPAQNSEGLYLTTLGQLLGLSIERIAMTSLLAAVLISFFWLTRSTVSVDRIVLGLTFGVATLFILMQYMHIQHMLLLVALILLLQGVIVATRIERVHHSNRL